MEYKIELEARSIKIINIWGEFIDLDIPNKKGWKQLKKFIDYTEGNPLGR